MSSATLLAILGDALADSIEDGVAIGIASSSADNIPSLAAACGCRIDGSAQALRVFVHRDGAEALLRDIRATGRVAAVITAIDPCRSVQVKSLRARVEPLDDEDRARVLTCIAQFAWQARQSGCSRCFVDHLFARGAENMDAVVFAPEQVFEQTPGLQAGRRLGVAA